MVTGILIRWSVTSSIEYEHNLLHRVIAIRST
jgi:hypothetical protein